MTTMSKEQPPPPHHIHTPYTLQEHSHRYCDQPDSDLGRESGEAGYSHRALRMGLSVIATLKGGQERGRRLGFRSFLRKSCVLMP